MKFDTTITKNTEKNMVYITIKGINKKIDEPYYNEYLKEILNNFSLAGIISGVTQTTYQIDDELIIVFNSDISSKIDLLLKHLNNKS